MTDEVEMGGEGIPLNVVDSAAMAGVTENDDGSVTIIEDEMVSASLQSVPFDANLADVLPEERLTAIANDLLDLIEYDKDSRSERDAIYKEGLQRTGLGKEAPGGADFQGASRATHPVLAEACVDFSSAAIKELFPPDGPVRIHSFADSARPDEIERAEAKRDYMNWQLVEEVPEYKSDLEVLLTQQPLSGCQYLKIWYDARLGRPCVEYIPSDMVYLPFAATSFSSTNRFTLVVPLTRYDFMQRVKSGIYRDVDTLELEPFTPEESSTQQANDKIEGRQEPPYNADGLRNIYEVYAYYSVEGEEPGDERPYIISIDVFSRKIVSIYRNWEEEDPTFQKLDWVVDFNFIPWRGAGGIGLIHLIGSLAGAATGALRALLDSAHLANFPGAARLKGARASGQNISFGPTEITEIEAPANIDDIRKVIMPMPFNQPSQVLFSLLGWLTEAAKGVVTTAEEKIADATNEMPVGTTLALIEQGSKVVSAIHGRLHDSQRRVLKIFQRLNYKYYNPEKQQAKFGKVLVPREDFLNTGNVVPVSDPHMFSEAQRFAQIQGVLQMAADQTVPWNKLAIYKRVLRIMHVQNFQEFFNEPPPPVSADPVTEIVAAMSGQQIRATPDMDHMLHISEELQYLIDPLFGAGNAEAMNPGFQVIMADIWAHLLFAYQQLKQQAAQAAQQQLVQAVLEAMVRQINASGLDQPPMTPDQLLQTATQYAQQPQLATQVQGAAQQLFVQLRQPYDQLAQLITQASQLVKAKVPPPQDPQAQAQIQIAQLQEQTKLQIAQAKDEIAQMGLQLKAAQDAARLEIEKLSRLQLDPALKQARIDVELEKNRDDNIQHHQTELLKNREDNITNLEIAQLREQGQMEAATAAAQQQAMLDILKLQQQDAESRRQLAAETERAERDREAQHEIQEKKDAHGSEASERTGDGD